jgi:hypothetical protein
LLVYILQLCWVYEVDELNPSNHNTLDFQLRGFADVRANFKKKIRVCHFILITKIESIKGKIGIVNIIVRNEPLLP